MRARLALAPWVREVDLTDVVGTRSDYWGCVLWCPECAREPMRRVPCRSCADVHTEPEFGPYLDCNACGSDLIWVGLEDSPTIYTPGTP